MTTRDEMTADRKTDAKPLTVVQVVTTITLVLLALSGIALVMSGVAFKPANALQQIYQLISIVGGLIIFALAGIWKALTRLDTKTRG
ncbi:hypothetical protein [Parvularcula sp. LCG005]|uniref:hypothetical protein n=1 Tax=Parvularcula sp. LCG005 TaxID=3078805 RepID=UPI0029426010|nr:hypothetical protein [Parvularcula sp. LCG005]WOI52448.1 hypothetical protein RUI03_09840 [Parvularcula sp. LCG005]